MEDVAPNVAGMWLSPNQWQDVAYFEDHPLL
jgi:hypothetical protein